MKFIVGFYACLLRLYPRRFRAEFADEMVEVFSLAVTENRAKSRMAFLGFMLWEMSHFPTSVLREQLHDYRGRHVLEDTHMLSHNWRTFRFCMSVLAVCVVMDVVLVIAPFYIYAINQQPELMVIGGNFDPKGYPMFYYQSPLGGIIYLISFFTMLTAPIFIVFFGGILSVRLARYWDYLLPRQRRLGSLVLLMSMALLIFTFSPLGRLIFTWHMD